MTFSALARYDVASNNTDDVLNVAVSVMQRIFALDFFGPTEGQQYSFVRAFGRNGGKSCIWVAKVLLDLRQGCRTNEE